MALSMRRCRVGGECHEHAVSGVDTGAGTMLGADRQHEHAAHWCDSASVAIAVDGDVDGGPPAAAKSFDDVLRYLDTRRSLSREKNRRLEFHDGPTNCVPPNQPAVCSTGAICATRMWLPNGSRSPKSMP